MLLSYLEVNGVAEINIQRIASSIPEALDEKDDPLVHIVRLSAQGFGTMLDPFMTWNHQGCYPLRQTFKILQRIKELGGKNYYLEA